MVEDCRHLWPAITGLDGFMITGISVHDRPEPVFTIHRNACSRSTGFGVHNPPERATSFQQGMAARVAGRLDQMHHERDAHIVAQRSTGTDLILIKKQVVEGAFSDAKIRLVSIAGLSRARAKGAFRQGLAAGDRINLNRPVGNAGRVLLP